MESRYIERDGVKYYANGHTKGIVHTNSDASNVVLETKLNNLDASFSTLQNTFTAEIQNLTVADPSSAEIVAARGGKATLGAKITEIDSQLAEKATKAEVTNVMTPKGTVAYSSLPTTGNEVGWYYYCPDGDGAHGSGNYVWNGTEWYFGGTGDQGYTNLRGELFDNGLIDHYTGIDLTTKTNAQITSRWFISDEPIKKGTIIREVNIYGKTYTYSSTYNIEIWEKIEDILTLKKEIPFTFPVSPSIVYSLLTVTGIEYETENDCYIAINSVTNAGSNSIFVAVSKIGESTLRTSDLVSDSLMFSALSTLSNYIIPCTIKIEDRIINAKVNELDIKTMDTLKSYLKLNGKILTINKNDVNAYQTIQAAVTASADGDILLVMPGIYEEHIEARTGKKISIMGLDKNHCIIKNSLASYAQSPLAMNVGLLKNFTIISEDNGVTVPGTEGTEVNGSYALHCDNYQQYMVDNNFMVEDCVFISDWNAAVGIGTARNYELTFKNCDFIGRTTYVYGGNAGAINGALVLHNASSPTYYGQSKINFINCSLRSVSDWAMRIMDLGDATNTLTLMMEKTMLWSDTMKKIDNIIYHTDSSSSGMLGTTNIYLDEKSYGNNMNTLNA